MLLFIILAPLDEKIIDMELGPRDELRKWRSTLCLSGLRVCVRVCECVLLMEAMASVSVCVFLVGMCVF